MRLSIKGRKHSTTSVTVREYDKLSTVWTRSVRAAIERMYELMVTDGRHIDTGMSAGTLVPIGRLVRAVGIGRIGARSKGHGPYRSTAYPGLGSGKVGTARAGQGGRSAKSLEHGIALGQRAFNQRRHSVLYGSPRRAIFVFRFSIEVLQLALHEIGGHSFKSPNPFGLLAKAESAFKKRFREEVRRLKSDLQLV